MNDEIPYNFGPHVAMPPGYRVAWLPCHEHYQAIGPDDWESPISVDPYWCRRCALAHAARATREALE
jgi:hypothetical protein